MTTHVEGARIGAYRLSRRLGDGLAGTVALAEDTVRGGLVAVRLLPDPRQSQARTPNDSSRQQFMREAERLRRLDAPGILPLLEYGEESGVSYVAAPYMAEGTLADALRAGRLSNPQQPLPLAPEAVAAIVRQVAAALQAAHDQDIVHEHVRTRNIFITWQGGADGVGAPDTAAMQPWKLLVADCGRAGLLRALAVDQRDASAALYSAPEQYAGLAEPASDQYALACMAFQLLTGQAVFTGTLEELERQHRAVAPPLASRANSRLPRALDAVFFQALAKSPSQRYPSVRDFALALESTLAEESARHPELRAPEPTLRLQMAALPASPVQPPGTDAERDPLETTKLTPPDGAVARVAAPRVPDGTPASLPHWAQRHPAAPGPHPPHLHLPTLPALPRRAGLAALALVVVLASLGGLAVALSHRGPEGAAQPSQVVLVGAATHLATQTGDIDRHGTVIFGALPALRKGLPPAQATQPQRLAWTSSQAGAVYAAAAHLSRLPTLRAPLSGIPGSARPLQQLSGLGQRDVGIAAPVNVSLGSGGGYVVEAVDGALMVYTSAGRMVGGPFALADVFALDLRAGETVGEPRVLFDAGSQHWLLVANALKTDQQGAIELGDFDLAVSADTNPLDGWTVYRLSTMLHGTMGCSWADDPRIGADETAYYLTGIQFHCGTDAYLIGPALWRLPKRTFATGHIGPVTVWTGFTTPYGKPALSLAPAVESGGTTTEWLVGSDAGYAVKGSLASLLTVWAVLDESHSGGTPTVLSAAVPLQYPYADPPLATQAGLVRPVETGDARVTSAVFAGGHLYAAFTTAVNWSGDNATRAGVYWLAMMPEISPLVGTGGQGAAGAPLPAHIVGFAGGDTFSPEIAADAAGDVALVMTASSATLAPSILYVVYHTHNARSAGGTPAPNTPAAAALLARSDQPTSHYWGDYMDAAFAPLGESGARPTVWVAGAVNEGAPATWRTTIWQLDIGGS